MTEGTITLANVRELLKAVENAKPPTHIMLLNEKGVWRTYKIGSRRIKQIISFHQNHE